MMVGARGDFSPPEGASRVRPAGDRASISPPGELGTRERPVSTSCSTGRRMSLPQADPDSRQLSERPLSTRRSSPPPRTVLHVLGVLNRGGVERRTLELLEALRGEPI